MRGDGLRVRVALWEDRRTSGSSWILRKGGSNDGRCLFRIEAWNGGSRNTGRPPGLPTGPIVLLTISVVFVRLKVGGYLWFLLQYGTVECAAAAVGALGVDDVGLTGDKLDLEPAAVARIVDIPGDAATGGDTAVSISGGGTLDGAVPRGLYYCEGRHIADSQTNDGEEGDDPRLTSTVTEAGTHYVSARCAAAENSAKRLPQRCVLVLPDRSLRQWNSVRHSVSGDMSMTMWCADTETGRVPGAIPARAASVAACLLPSSLRGTSAPLLADRSLQREWERDRRTLHDSAR